MREDPPVCINRSYTKRTVECFLLCVLKVLYTLVGAQVPGEDQRPWMVPAVVSLTGVASTPLVAPAYSASAVNLFLASLVVRIVAIFALPLVPTNLEQYRLGMAD